MGAVLLTAGVADAADALFLGWLLVALDIFIMVGGMGAAVLILFNFKKKHVSAQEPTKPRRSSISKIAVLPVADSKGASQELSLIKGREKLDELRNWSVPDEEEGKATQIVPSVPARTPRRSVNNSSGNEDQIM